jgi:1,4-alpha-glucan branching enzyme
MKTLQPSIPKPAAKTANLALHKEALGDYDIFLFKQGAHNRLFDKLGAHLIKDDKHQSARFGVWAPNALSVSVIGDFNGWNADVNPMTPRADSSGIWEAFVPHVAIGDHYKYRITFRDHSYAVDKSDPFAFFGEPPPKTASRVWALDYVWADETWMRSRKTANALDAPISIYEVHLGSWRRPGDNPGRLLSYREIAPLLADYIRETGFTHVEFMPLTEHPFYGSWGYQTTGYFSPSARYGSPQDLMYLIDHLHQCGIGVILDWVPSHFPNDEHGLAYFDGSHLFEHADRRQGFHPEWNSHIFNLGRHEVRAFLVSSALFWLEKYHFDGLRIDAVASMLYLDYSRLPGEWIPNVHGGKENLESIAFLRQLNETIYREHPDVQSIAEESTSWSQVSRPVNGGGLGFGMKWNLGWMHDTLDYFKKNPLFRKYHQHELTFSLWYAFYENFVLPLSHDEVVHGKGALIDRMPGDEWQRYANLRSLFGYMWGHPGKKLLFMGGEFGQQQEWKHDESLQWDALQYPIHSGLRDWIRDLNRYYRQTPALFELDFSSEGFEWIDLNDAQNSVLSFIRIARSSNQIVLVVCNFTPLPREQYSVGVPRGGLWKEVLNSDSGYYGGSGVGNLGGVRAAAFPMHGRPFSLTLSLPPLGVLFFESVM